MSSPYPPQYDPFGQQQPPQFPSPGGYYVPQSDPRYGIRPPGTSPLAILSLIGGIVSLLVCWMTCCCIFSPFVFASSVASIAMGHIALSQIQRSQGAVGGREMAWVGLGTAYPAAVVSGFFFGLLIFTMVAPAPPAAPPGPVTPPAAGEVELEAAETKIASDSFGTAHGNSAAAIALAEKFNARMQTLRDELAKKNPGWGIADDDGEFITWCELRNNRCAFIVHVPNYRNYKTEGEAEIESLAWTTAQEVVRGTLPADASLAVGTKGLLLWGNVMTGKTVAEGSTDNGLGDESDDYELLYSYFAAPSDAVPEDGSIKLPEEPSATPKSEDAKPEKDSD